MSELIDLSNLTPDAIEQLKAILGSSGGTNRSPMWKPLRDMRPPTTAKGRLNRPHFEWSAEDDGHTVIPAYPRLYWDEQGIERRVETAEADKLTPPTWRTMPPGKQEPINQAAVLQAQFDALSPEDQAYVLEAQKQTRLKRIHELMSGLSESDIASLTPKPIVDSKSKRSA